MKLENKHFEFACLLFFFGLLVYYGMGVIMDHKISHETPYGYMASDAFWDLAQQTSINDAGNYKYMPYYMRAGFKDTIGFHMPVFGHLVVLFSKASNVPIHDSNLIVTFFFSIISVMVAYLIARNFSKNAAIISLAFAAFIYIKNFNIVYTWGIWDVVVASSFVLASVWALDKLELKYFAMILGILAAAVVLTHITEAFYIGMFIGVLMLVKLLKKELKLADIKKILFAGIIALLLSFYYLIIFKNGYGKAGVFSLALKLTNPESYDVVLGNFGLAQYAIIAGLAISLSIVLTKEKYLAPLMGAFFFFAGYTNFNETLGPRALQIRYLWPVYICILGGIAVYFLINAVIKSWKIYFSVILSMILGITIVGAYYTSTPQQGLVDKSHWQAISWFKDNSNEDAKILFFYGDPYTQEAVTFNTKRLGYRTDFNDFRDSLINKKIKRFYNINVAAADDGELLYRKSFLKFGYHYMEVNMSKYFGQQDICSFDYYVFDKVSRQQALAEYNKLIALELSKKDFIKPVFNNDIVVILKNNKIGADCIEERNF